MIIGLGVDIIEVERVRAIFERYGLKFVKKILGRQENKYFSEMYNNHSPQSRELLIAFLAKRFAAKEAVSKALGTGIKNGVNWKNIEIVNRQSGKPIIYLYGKAQDKLLELTPKNMLSEIHISITDEKELAQALAVIDAEKER